MAHDKKEQASVQEYYDAIRKYATFQDVLTGRKSGGGVILGLSAAFILHKKGAPLPSSAATIPYFSSGAAKRMGLSSSEARSFFPQKLPPRTSILEITDQAARAGQAEGQRLRRRQNRTSSRISTGFLIPASIRRKELLGQ